MDAVAQQLSYLGKSCQEFIDKEERLITFQVNQAL